MLSILTLIGKQGAESAKAHSHFAKERGLKWDSTRGAAMPLWCFAIRKKKSLQREKGRKAEREKEKPRSSPELSGTERPVDGVWRRLN